MIDSAEKLQTTIFMVGDIGGNEIDAVTVSIISKQKKKILFIFLAKWIVMIIDS